MQKKLFVFVVVVFFNWVKIISKVSFSLTLTIHTLPHTHLSNFFLTRWLWLFCISLTIFAIRMILGKSFTAPQLEPYWLNLESRDCFAKNWKERHKTRNKQNMHADFHLQLTCVHDHKLKMIQIMYTRNQW